MKKIGLYGGTFDPVHFGHLNLAIELREREGLDEVWMIPAHLSPHKIDHFPPASLEHRHKMLELAVEEIPFLKVKNLEGQRPPPSYTVHTLQILLAEYTLQPSPYQFFLLMGEDSVQDFSKWYKPDEIIKIVPLFIGSRTGQWNHNKDSQRINSSIANAIEKGMRPIPTFDISSTQVRKRLGQKLYCGHLVPHKVLDYIYQNNIYG